MNIDLDFGEIEQIEFRQALHWFEEEFDYIFGNKTHGFNNQEIKIANQLLDKLSETINKYHDERLLYSMIYTLNNIEKKHPEFFGD